MSSRTVPPTAKIKCKAVLAYVLPFLVYVSAPSLSELFFKDPLTGYAARVLLTLPILVYFLNEYREIRITRDWLGPVLGVLTIMLWLGLDPFYPKFFPKTAGLALEPLSLILKFVGMVVLAPWMEELFFRSFLPRYLEKGASWSEVRPGSFTPFSFLVSAALFGALHFEWLPALLMGLGLNWLYQRTKNLWPCIVAHSIANLILWGEVFRTQNPNLW